MLSQLPINFIITALLENPDTDPFPWSGHGFNGNIPRSALQNEVNNRPLSKTVHPNPSRPISGLHAIGGSNHNLD